LCSFVFNIFRAKKYSNTKTMISQKCEIFFCQIFLYCSEDNCAKVHCFVSYLLDIGQVGANAKSICNLQLYRVQKADIIVEAIKCPIPSLL